MTYYLYHIPGKKIGITKDLKKRVEEQQGYDKDEYDIIMQTDDIAKISEYELFLSSFSTIYLISMSHMYTRLHAHGS